jgi:hypothetical protein
MNDMSDGMEPERIIKVLESQRIIQSLHQTQPVIELFATFKSSKFDEYCSCPKILSVEPGKSSQNIKKHKRVQSACAFHLIVISTHLTSDY